MPKQLAAALLVLALCACSSREEVVAATTSAVIDSHLRTSATETAAQAPAMSVPPTTSSPMASFSTAVSPATAALVPTVSLVNVASDCGPADGNWVRGSATALEAQIVFAQLSLDGVTYGRSEAVVLEAGVPTTIGFDPERPPTTFGKTGRFEVLLVGTSAVIAAADVVLKLPASVSCG